MKEQDVRPLGQGASQGPPQGGANTSASGLTELNRPGLGASGQTALLPAKGRVRRGSGASPGSGARGAPGSAPRPPRPPEAAGLRGGAGPRAPPRGQPGACPLCSHPDLHKARVPRSSGTRPGRRGAREEGLGPGGAASEGGPLPPHPGPPGPRGRAPGGRAAATRATTERRAFLERPRAARCARRPPGSGRQGAARPRPPHVAGARAARPRARAGLGAPDAFRGWPGGGPGSSGRGIFKVQAIKD